MKLIVVFCLFLAGMAEGRTQRPNESLISPLVWDSLPALPPLANLRADQTITRTFYLGAIGEFNFHFLGLEAEAYWGKAAATLKIVLAN